MTASFLDELRTLSNSKMQEEQAKADTFRPETRPIPTEFTAHCKISGEVRTGSRQDGSGWETNVVCLHFTNVNVLETHRGQTFSGTNFDYDIPVAKRAKSQLGYTVASIAEVTGEDATIFSIDDKDVHIVEKVVPAPRNKAGEIVKDKNGYNLKPTFYYAVTEIGQANKPAEVTSDQAKNAALAFSVGKTRSEFVGGVVPYLKGEGIEVSANDQLYFISPGGTGFLGEAQKAGKLGLNEAEQFTLLERF